MQLYEELEKFLKAGGLKRQPAQVPLAVDGVLLESDELSCVVFVEAGPPLRLPPLRGKHGLVPGELALKPGDRVEVILSAVAGDFEIGSRDKTSPGKSGPDR